jgi:OmpA-OmpF porin, OOP family
MELENMQPIQPARASRGRRYTLLAASLLAATAAFNTHAQPRAGMVFINPAAQYIWYGSDRAGDVDDYEDRLGWQIGAEYLITDNFGIEAVYSQQDPKLENDAVRHFIDVEDRRWRLDGLYYFTNSTKWAPYIAGGAGEGRFDYDVDAPNVDFDGHDRETQLNLGGGVRYFLNDHVSLRGDLRAVHSLDESKTDAVASLGISFAFGGEKPAPVVAPPPPPPEPVAPPPPPPEPEIEKVKLSSEALFDFDKATLRPGAKQSLDELARRLSNYPKQIDSIKVFGHTDRLGAADYNQRLSTERATAVKDYLASQGVPAAKIRAEGKGSSDPVTTDCQGTKRSKALIECLQADRRVEVHITVERQVPAK